MKKNLTVFRIIFQTVFFFTIALYLSGCVNVDQKTKINEDGSGSIQLEYWTNMSNLSTGTELGGFHFEEGKARDNYSSANTEVKSIEIKEDLDDSTTHVILEIEFTDINNLNQAEGFEKVTAQWVKGDDGMDFSYIIEQDSSSASNMGASETKLNYTFEFPSEVTSTNGKKDGNTVVFNKTLADLMEDLEMTATVKTKSKGCGLFGLEFPLIVLAGLIFAFGRKRKK